MKTIKNLFKMYANYKSMKLRLRSVELALKSDTQSQNIVDVAARIDKYIKDGL